MVYYPQRVRARQEHSDATYRWSFRSLTGGWTFSALSEEACKIELNLEFEFSNKLAEMAFGKVFNSLATSMVTAFTERARSVYA